MSITQFATPGVLAPLQGFWRWLMPAAEPVRPIQPKPNTTTGDFALRSISPNTRCAKAELRKPLRIVRVLEAGQGSAHVGRMVISGRMSDVCAELDRLAAREAALH